MAPCGAVRFAEELPMTPLRRRMIEDMRIRNLSPHTQRAYVEQVSRFARHFGRPPELLGQDEIRSWQIYLVEERRLAASSISVAVAPVCLCRHPQKALDCRRRHPNQPATEETPRCPEPGGSRPIPGRGGQPQTSDDPDRVLRDGAAHFRGGFPEARRDRQPMRRSDTWNMPGRRALYVVKRRTN